MGTKAMFETGTDAAAPRPRSLLRMLALAGATLFLIAVAIGYVAGWRNKHDAFNAELGVALAIFALLICGSAWLLLREARRPIGSDPLTPKEQLNLNILIGSGLAGAVMGVALSLAGASADDPLFAFSNAPMPPVLAAVMIVAILLIVPVSLYWQQRVVDEQEAAAYKAGALYGIYVYWIGSAIWWFAWRGGFAPEPSGIIIYFATMATVGGIWLWKKYG